MHRRQYIPHSVADITPRAGSRPTRRGSGPGAPQRLSSAWRSSDGRAIYANDQNGSRRRLEETGDGLVLRGRATKREMKIAKRRRIESRRRGEVRAR
jgi:hypothetical protein